MAEGTTQVPVGDLEPPSRVDRIIVHQIDVAHPVPGGIDGAIRGMLRFAPIDDVVAVVGVLATPEPGRAVGRWERYEIDGRIVWLLPVAVLDASDQRRRVPHSIRLMAGLLRHRGGLPRADRLHAHRADTAFVSRLMLRGVPLDYFVHTQSQGLSAGVTDSFWHLLPWLHRWMERRVVAKAATVTVFNPDFADELSTRNSAAAFSPSWFEPDLTTVRDIPRHPHRVVWLGRLEPPKDPLLAVDVMQALVAADPEHPWSLLVIGSGTLEADLAARVAQLPADVAEKVTLAGRMAPAQVGEALGESGVFLMTSRPGYEGHPRVLIEALASGLPAVVTEGSDTGALVEPGVNGAVCSRDPAELAAAVIGGARLDRARARASVEHLSGPAVVGAILGRTRDA